MVVDVKDYERDTKISNLLVGALLAADRRRRGASTLTVIETMRALPAFKEAQQAIYRRNTTMPA